MYNGENITSPFNKVNVKPGDHCHTLGTDSRNYVVIPIHDKATRYKGGGPTRNGDGAGADDREGAGVGEKAWGIDHAIPTGGNCTAQGPCVYEDIQATLKASGTHAVCYVANYQNTGAGWWNESDIGTTLRTPCGGDATFANTVVEKSEQRYIVRRLTPTECARLQGFPDTWGHPDHKTDFSDEEYRFWLDVRNTHAAINGKVTKEYNKEQMLTWYNKLHTDSSEYKMWGNGIALPCALYVMQGIADELRKE